MTIDLLKQFEEIPAEYPVVTPFNRLGIYTDEDVVTNDAQIWQRIESYIAHRWTPREVVWTFNAHGGDEFHPRLTPMLSYVAHYWGDQWEGLTLLEGPMGLCLPFDGTYRITAQVGGGDVPEAVQEAYKRMNEYTRGINDSFKNEAAHTGDGETSGIVRNWAAKSMQLSGAADLLRPYRRA